MHDVLTGRAELGDIPSSAPGRRGSRQAEFDRPADRGRAARAARASSSGNALAAGGQDHDIVLVLDRSPSLGVRRWGR